MEDVGSGEKKSSKSSSKPLPFFRSSLEELRERREARARVEEEARKEGEGGVVDGAATSEMKDGRGEDVKGRQENTKSEEVQMRDVDEEVSSAEEKNNEDGRDMTEEPDTSAEMEELRGKAVEGDDLEHVERQQNFSSASPSAPHLLSPPSSQPLNALRSQSGSAPPLTSQTPQIPSQLPHSPPTPSPASPAPRAERLTDNYHIYLDTTGFEYKINLFRINMPRNAIGRYSLRLFESHTKPHVYCTFIQYIPAPEKPAAEAEGNRKAANGVPILVGGWKDPKTEQGKSWGKAGTGRATAKGKGKNTNGIKTSAKPNNNNNSIDSKLLTILGPTSSTTKPPATAPPKPTYKSLLAPLNSDFPTAFDAFISAFYELTFLPWHLRLHPSAREIQKCNAGTAKLEPFLYKPPEPGLPAGLVPELPLAMEPFESEGVRRFRLPGMEVRLSGEYSLGAEILREENARLEAVRREEERRREKEKERVRREKEAKGKVRRERVRPFFGGVYKDEYL